MPDPKKAPTPPPTTPGLLLYECYLCHDRYVDYPVIDGPGYLRAVAAANCQLGPAAPNVLQMFHVHACDDGRQGLSFIVGMQPGGWKPTVATTAGPTAANPSPASGPPAAH